MINISDEEKALWKSGIGFKEFTVTFPEVKDDVNTGVGEGYDGPLPDGIHYKEIIVRNDGIRSESFSMKESIMANNQVNFVGCIATQMTIDLQCQNDLDKEDYIGREIHVDVQLRYTNSSGIGNLTNPIRLFTGFVEDTDYDHYSTYISFTCYDALYTKLKNLNVNTWYKKYKFKTYKDKSGSSINGKLIENFRKSLQEEITKQTGIEFEEQNLGVDKLQIKKQYKTDWINGLECIQGICQLNGCFGKINRRGKFQYIYIGTGYANNWKTRTIPKITNYPVKNADPSDPFVPGLPNIIDTTYPDYLKFNSIENIKPEHYIGYSFQDYVVLPFNKYIKYRESQNAETIANVDEKGSKIVLVKDIDYEYDWKEDEWLADKYEDTVYDPNCYMIEGNVWLYKVGKKAVKNVLAAIQTNVGELTALRTYSLNTLGLPYIETGDILRITDPYGEIRDVWVFNRTLKGIQKMNDSFEYEIDKKTNEYIAQGQNLATKVDETKVKHVSIAVTEGTLRTMAGENSKGYLTIDNWDPVSGVLETKTAAITTNSIYNEPDEE